MKRVSLLISAVLFSISIVGSALAEPLTPESGILVRHTTDGEMAGGMSLSITWFLRSFSTLDGCLIVVYHFPKNGLSDSESLETYKVAQRVLLFGERAEVPEWNDDFSLIVTCDNNGETHTTERLKIAQ